VHISLVVAVAENGVIGADNGLPWRLQGEMRHFRATTMGKPVIMGRKTHESIGRPLRGRTNIMLTRAGVTVPDGVILVHSLQEAFKQARDTGADEACVIGGADIYAQSLPFVDTLHLTRVHMHARGDVMFPPFNADEWRQTSAQRFEANAQDTAAYTIMRLDRIGDPPMRAF